MARRTLLLSLALLTYAVTGVQAQTRGRFRYVAEVPNLSTLAREKGLSEALNDWDPSGIYHIEATEGTAELFVANRIDLAEFAEHLAAHGYAIGPLRIWNAAVDSLQMVQATDPDDFPLYPATGDRVADNAEYDRAKAKWIAAHPPIKNNE